MNLKLKHNFEFGEHKDGMRQRWFWCSWRLCFAIELVIFKSNDLFSVVPSNALKYSM